jgi:hypothetical protein
VIGREGGEEGEKLVYFLRKIRNIPTYVIFTIKHNQGSVLSHRHVNFSSDEALIV